jgi:hypothetical protein
MKQPPLRGKIVSVWRVFCQQDWLIGLPLRCYPNPLMRGPSVGVHSPIKTVVHA